MKAILLPVAAGLATFFGAIGLVSLWKLSIYRYLRARPQRAGRGRSALLRGLFPFAGAFAVGVGFWIGRPIFGLGVLFALAFAGKGIVEWNLRRRRDSLDRSSLAWFHALRGLLQAGVSLPSALFRLAELESSPFPAALREYLDHYQQGRSLARCLASFRRRGEVDRAASLLSLLEMAYRSGLPVCPLLERALPVLESERSARDRVTDIRRSVLFQAGLVGLAPWLLSAVYWTFEPEAAARVASASWFPFLALGAIGWEAFGGGTLWALSRFD